MTITIVHGEWTFTLTPKELLISGYGMSKTYKHTGMSPDTLKGFAQGWSGYHSDPAPRFDRHIQLDQRFDQRKLLEDNGFNEV